MSFLQGMALCGAIGMFFGGAMGGSTDGFLPAAALLSAVVIAQAIEARRAATENTGAVEDESAVGKADAPKGGRS